MVSCSCERFPSATGRERRGFRPTNKSFRCLQSLVSRLRSKRDKVVRKTVAPHTGLQNGEVGAGVHNECIRVSRALQGGQWRPMQGGQWATHARRATHATHPRLLGRWTRRLLSTCRVSRRDSSPIVVGSSVSLFPSSSSSRSWAILAIVGGKARSFQP